MKIERHSDRDLERERQEKKERARGRERWVRKGVSESEIGRDPERKRGGRRRERTKEGDSERKRGWEVRERNRAGEKGRVEARVREK